MTKMIFEGLKYYLKCVHNYEYFPWVDAFIQIAIFPQNCKKTFLKKLHYCYPLQKFLLF
jgi:hypothetical protein